MSYPIKREYSLHDFERSALRRRAAEEPRRVPYSHAERRARFWWLADSDAERARQWARHCLRVYFARGVDLSDARAAARARRGSSASAAEAAEAVWKRPGLRRG